MGPEPFRFQATVRGKRGSESYFGGGKGSDGGSLQPAANGTSTSYEYAKKGGGTDLASPFLILWLSLHSGRGCRTEGEKNPQKLPVLERCSKSCFVLYRQKVSAFSVHAIRYSTLPIVNLMGKAVRSNIRSVFTDYPPSGKAGIAGTGAPQRARAFIQL